MGRDTPTSTRSAWRREAALQKPHLAQCGVTLRDTRAEAKFTAIATPSRDQLARFFAHRHRHLDRARRGRDRAPDRKRLDAGETQRSIARSYNVSQSTISRL